MAAHTPILLIVFNRPAETQQVLNAIRNIQPAQLYIAADGPRPDRPDDIENCAKVREIVSNVSWPCTVKTLYREKNLGCMLGVSGAIDWFFENEEEGIILEDDCVPNPSFYSFCIQLLEKYRQDKRIYAICGRNPMGTTSINESYLFSRFFKEWGWASWRRAWQQRNLGKENFDRAVKEAVLERTLNDVPMARYTLQTNESVHYSGHNTWDYQWLFNILSQNGLVIVPRVNLVENVGLNSGVHFGDNPNIIRSLYKVDTEAIEKDLVHPAFVFADTRFDQQCFYAIHPYLLPKKQPLLQKVRDSILYRTRKLIGKYK
jgi:hypothetical protein